MPVMAKLSADPFWPPGTRDSDMHVPFPKLTTDSSSSIISPLTLPRGVHGYFDHVVVTNSNNPTHPRPVSQPRGSQIYSPLSPHILPAAQQAQFQYDQSRSSSLPPTTRNGVTSPRLPGNGSNKNQDMAAGLTNKTLGSPGGGLAYSRSVSADEVTSSSHDCMVRRLLQQKARMQEAWEAERKYLEANRERAEEVYKEERALMEEERAEWEAEKAVLVGEIERLGGTNPSLSSEKSSHLVGQNGGSAARNASSPLPIPGPRAQDLASPRSPNGPSAPTADFLKQDEALEAAAEPIPIVDVKEIHPELEGIPIKATSVKKATFRDTGSQNGSKSSSPSGSPPSGSDQPQSPRAKKEQTLQVLAAKEADRLTMHAGHTPNHSLSSVATAVSSGTATATSNSGDSTPTMPHEEVASQGTTTGGDGGGVSGSQQGPLMVRNMPAHDEIFFQKLSDKLEEVSKDNVAALPAVLKDSELAKQTAPPAAGETKTQAEDQPGAGSGVDSEDNKSSPKSGDEEQFDVPLKFKKRMNFGAPFGEFR
ncbi:hypothetical protein CHGG_06600 [Chaetomium globosum CBS 148.51]|uniref:Uncharacterized protein n=1 Tax=Chaetomium globosum (strain ATCC 6205 / CBS 148.51 / DSM 1962 / NBRC 6347 / NRRL 1970) TaxID=306901 RepID=Q2H415_CHAGB|nr:uncharacterized protein CHGG_06600 [Chaetomium globosum CBS 148.51]EAQ89981.1 hypothetical protein CHGG_06600 [Chaetomium globosum CBS 148.51]